MSKKVIDDTPMVVMDDLEDILMEDLDDILAKSGSQPAEKKTQEPAETPKQEVSPEEKTESETETQPESEEKAALEAGEQPEAEEKAEPEAGEQPEAEKERPRVPVFAPKLSDIEKEKESAEAADSKKDGKLLGMYDAGDSDKGKKDGKGKDGSGKKTFWKKFLIACAVVIAVAAVGAYGYGVYYYSHHFLPATVTAGVSLDNLTVEEAQEKLAAAKKAEDSTLELTTLDGQKVIMDTSAMGITRTYLGLPEALAAQEKWIFPLSKNPVKDLDLSYEISYDRAAAKNCLKALEICDPEKSTVPVDAYVIRDAKDGWKVVPAVDGNTIDLEVLSEAVVKAVDGKQKELNIKDSGAYLTAQVREDDPMLVRKADVENKIDALEFTVDMGADTFHTITADDFREMLVEGVEYEEAPEAILDAKKFDLFMDRFARKYNTKSLSGYRCFKSVTGDNIVMKSDYGWDMNRQATAEVIGTMLEQAGRKVLGNEELKETYPHHEVAAVWNQTAVSHGERDTGESWVEVNITQQKMCCIIDGEVKLEGNVVSGTETVESRRTPSGIFAIRFKSTERDLVGYNADGTESYRSHVHYWMPIYKNIGLHDATWRGSFGGNIYKYNGSHGCINLALKTAEKLYGMVEKGMPVIVYREKK